MTMDNKCADWYQGLLTYLVEVLILTPTGKKTTYFSDGKPMATVYTLSSSSKVRIRELLN